LFAKQPLTPEQLYYAILSGVKPEVLKAWDIDKITEDVIRKYILSSSKGLAQITRSKMPTVQFIHESVKDFLLRANGLSEIWTSLRSNFQGQSHERLKQCCLEYMNIDISTHLDLSRPLPKASSKEIAALRRSATNAFPFLKYAIRNVLYHADVAGGCGIAQRNVTQTFPLAHWVKLDNLFNKNEDRRYTEDVSLLYVLAARDMANLIRVHPSIFSCLEVEKERYGPPLFAALATGSKKAVRTFVEVYSATKSPESWLHNLCSSYCCNKGSWFRCSKGSCSRYMCEHDFEFWTCRTTLSYLAEFGDGVLFTLGLEIGNILPDSKDQDGRTPLAWAAAKGHEEVVKLLLGTGKVDVDSKDVDGRTPLSRAAFNGHEAVVKLLLNTGKVDVNLKDVYRQTSLSRAVEKRNEAVVRLLLDTGKVDVDSKDVYGQTPLSRAVETRHEGVVKLLLNTGKVDVNLKDGYGQTPLSRAVETRHEGVVRLLLSTGKVDVNLKDGYGKTLLCWAIESKNERVFKLLLDTGKIDVDSKDRDGQTPLSRAALSGRETIVKLLLDTGKVDVISKDRYDERRYYKRY
jgi:ankyrin repeat protein